MSKVSARDLKHFLRSNGLSATGSILETMKIGCELGYLTDEDIIFMSSASEVAAQNRLTSARKRAS